MIIYHGKPCLSCEHYSPDDRDYNHWVCDFDHNTCPHIEALHKAVGYKKRIDVEVLDKIRAKLHATAEIHEDGDYYLREEWIDKIFDKYKAERSDKE